MLNNQRVSQKLLFLVVHTPTKQLNPPVRKSDELGDVFVLTFRIHFLSFLDLEIVSQEESTARCSFIPYDFGKFHIVLLWIPLLVGGLEHVYFSIQLGIIIPTDKLIFFRGGRYTTNQPKSSHMNPTPFFYKTPSWNEWSQYVPVMSSPHPPWLSMVDMTICGSWSLFRFLILAESVEAAVQDILVDDPGPAGSQVLPKPG